MRNRVAIGGACGFLGTYLTARFLAFGCHVVALARPRGGQSARDRVEAALRDLPDFGELSLERLQVLPFDLTGTGEAAPEAGDLEALRSIPFVNTIASLKYGEHHRSEILDTNVAGTERLLQTLIAAGASRLYHVSTAYVCGQIEGDVEEVAIDPDLTCFNNLYEESKATAENLLLGQDQLPVDIFRPSIIAGSSRSGWARNYTGYYTLYSVLHGALAAVRRTFDKQEISFLPLRLPGIPDVNSDVVPVDYVAEVIFRVVETDGQSGSKDRSPGQVMHIVSQDPRPTAYFLAAMARHLGVEGAQFVRPRELKAPHLLERWCASMLRFNNAYTVRGYSFLDDQLRIRLGAAAPVCPEMDGELLDRLNDFYLARLHTGEDGMGHSRREKLAEQLVSIAGFTGRNNIALEPADSRQPLDYSDFADGEVPAVSGGATSHSRLSVQRRIP